MYTTSTPLPPRSGMVYCEGLMCTQTKHKQVEPVLTTGGRDFVRFPVEWVLEKAADIKRRRNRNDQFVMK